MPAIVEEKNRSDPTGLSQTEYKDNKEKNRGGKRGIIGYIFVAMVIGGAVWLAHIIMLHNRVYSQNYLFV